jgi:hypothetical protein
MDTYEVDMELIITCKVKVIVPADSPAEAIDAAAEKMPTHYEAASQGGWKAAIDVTPPKGVMLLTGQVKGTYFQTASGGEKARKVAHKVGA